MFPSKEGISSIRPEIAIEELPHVNQMAQEGLGELLTLLTDLNYINIQTHPKTYQLYLQKALNTLKEVTDQLNTLTGLVEVELLQKNDQLNSQIPSPLLNDEFVDNFIREMNKGHSE